MLKQKAGSQWTTATANINNSGDNTLTLFKNTFIGTDGAAPEFSGTNVVLDNNLFEYNDWTTANMIHKSGGLGTIISNGIDDVFVRNTVRFNGGNRGYRPGLRSVVRLNHFHHQYWGLIQVNTNFSSLSVYDCKS